MKRFQGWVVTWGLLLWMVAGCTAAPNASSTATLVATSTPLAPPSATAPAPDRFANLPETQTALGFPQLGFPSAPVSVVIYSSFDCADCVLFHQQVFPRLIERARAGEALLTFIPLHNAQNVGSDQTAARAAFCASEQSRFWPYADQLFTLAARGGAAAFTPEALTAALEPTGVEAALWESCMVSSRPNVLATTALNVALAQFDGAAFVLAVVVNNEPVSPLLDVVDRAITTAVARVDAAVESAINATNTPSVESTPDPLSTQPVVVTLPPVQNAAIEPPLTLDLPEGWRGGSDILLLNDVTGMRSVPFSVYTGPVTGGQGSIVLLWGFPNLTTGSPFEAVQIDLFSDGLRLLRLAIVEPGCNVGTDVRREYDVGGMAAVGTQFSAVGCPGLPDTRGWFAGLQQNGINFIFYAYTDPIDAIDGARAELRSILSSVRFALPTPAPTPTTP